MRSGWPLAFVPAAVMLAFAALQFGGSTPHHPRPHPTTTTSTSSTTTTINAPGTLECSAGPGLRVRTGAVEGAHMHDCRPA